MEHDTGEKTVGNRTITAVLTAVMVTALPAIAWASPVQAPPSVAKYTATAIGIVLVVAVFLSVGLNIAYRFRFVGSEQQARLARQLRVGFGVVFLLAMVTPYMSLNFSAALLVPFVAGSGIVVAAWVWGASGSEFDTETTPPTADGV